MIKTLVAIEVDLASSMAIRYACSLGQLIQMELYPVYVKAPPPEVPAVGTGWVRHTWEREIVAIGKEEIAEMIAAEEETCPLLQEPRVIYGDRDYELNKILSQEAFSLYLEGAPFPFTPANIYRRLHSKFYQRLNCPLIWLRVLRKIHRVMLSCQDPAGIRALATTFQTLFAGANVPIHVAVPTQESHIAATEALRQESARAIDALAEADLDASLKEVPFSLTGPDPNIMEDYGLVGVALERSLKKDDPRLQWLAQVKAPLLLAFY